MPSQFRYFESSPNSESGPKFESGSHIVTPQVDQEPKGKGESLLNPLRNAISSLFQKKKEIEVPNVDESIPEEAEIASGINGIVKNTDFWFNYQISLLGKSAVDEAVRWA